LDYCSIIDRLQIQTYNKYFRNLKHSYTIIKYNRKLSTIIDGDSGLNSCHIVPYFPYNRHCVFPLLLQHDICFDNILLHFDGKIS
jgi:hypothetical protein